MYVEDIISKLKRAKPSNDGWLACCPAHDDHNPSLSISVKNDKILLHCFAGCKTEDILMKIGLTMNALFANQSQKTKYLYTDEFGIELYKVLRVDRPGEPKLIWQEPADGKNLKDVKHFIYHLPEVRDGIKKGKFVYICEGEKSVDVARIKFGLVATTNSGGAGNWSIKNSEFLSGAQVVIIPDNDEPGKKHAEKIKVSLHNIVRSVKIVELPGLPPKGDIVDWNGTKEDLERLVNLTQDCVPSAEPLTKQNFFQNIDWSCTRFVDNPPEQPVVVKDMIPKGIVAMLYSAGGVGKSTLLLNWLVRIALANTHKVTIMGHEVIGGNCALISSEDPEQEINRRLIEICKSTANEYGLDYSTVRSAADKHLKIACVIGKPVQFFSLDLRNATLVETDYFKSLKSFLSGIDNLQLIGVDTKARFSPGEGAGNNIATQEVGHYESLANATNATIMLLHHTNKASRNGTLTGAQAFRDASALFDSMRGCWYLRPVTVDEKKRICNSDSDMLVLENSKNNYAPILDPIVLKRSKFHFEMIPMLQVLTRQDDAKQKALECLNILINVLITDNGEPWSQKKIISLCKSEELSMHKTRQAIKDAESDGLIIEKSGKLNGHRAEYILTSKGKNYESVSSL